MNPNEQYIDFNSDLILSTLLADEGKVLEAGLHFNGETKIDENMYVVTDKRVEIDGLMETKKTYLKVMEMRELTEEEMKYANKARHILSKMFEIMFYNKKIMIAWTLFVCTTLGIDIASGNFLGIALKSICLLLINRPIKFIKEVTNILNSDKKKEELTDYLRENHVLGYALSVDDNDDIKMYAKVRNG